jgi:predicted nucleic acid-binding protein
MAILETTFLIDLMKETKSRREGRATRKLAELIDRGEVLRTAIFTTAELYVGVSKGTQPERESKAIQQCLALFQVLPFEEDAARIFGSIVGNLEKRGEVISDMDALIASVAVKDNELLVTRNVNHFQRVPGLRVEGY